MNILIVSAHGDDEILGCGGTISRYHRQGHKTHIWIASQGREDQIDQKMDIWPIRDFITKIEEKIAQTNPEIVFTHYLHDLNKDHRIIAEATKVACRMGGNVKALYSYESASSTEFADIPFHPNIYIELTKEDVDFKIKTMNTQYKQEMRGYPHPRSNLGIETLARYRGTQFRVEYAEAFQLIWKII